MLYDSFTSWTTCSFLSIYSVDTILYSYTLPLIQSPYTSSSLYLSCNLSSSLRSLYCWTLFSNFLCLLIFRRHSLIILLFKNTIFLLTETRIANLFSLATSKVVVVKDKLIYCLISSFLELILKP